ncbi:hypothetical protein ACFQZ4_45240 [Catellatospora coxensis]
MRADQGSPGNGSPRRHGRRSPVLPRRDGVPCLTGRQPPRRAERQDDRMTFHISVHRIADRERLKEPAPTDIGALRAWMADRADLTVFDEFLGANWAIGDHWSDHAERLGLPILASLYEVGCTHGVQIEGRAWTRWSANSTSSSRSGDASLRLRTRTAGRSRSR